MYLEVLHCIFPYMYTKISSEASQGSLAHIYTRSSIFCGWKIFLFNAAVQCFFFHSLSVYKGETEGYVKLTAEEIAVKRFTFFFFPGCFFPPVLPVLLAFSRHLDFQKTFY